MYLFNKGRERNEKDKREKIENKREKREERERRVRRVSERERERGRARILNSFLCILRNYCEI